MGKRGNMKKEEQKTTEQEQEQKNTTQTEEHSQKEYQDTENQEQRFDAENEEITEEEPQETEKKAKGQEAEESEIEKLQREVQEWKDKYLRLSAEFDNFRKRTMKEKSELMKSAGEDILGSFLPIMDDFERAKESIQNANDVEAVKEGVELIYNKFKDFLESKGIQEIEAKGKDFNTDEHNAMTKAPAPTEEEKGKVIDVLQKGYYLNNKVLRHARVVVGE